MEMLPSPSSLCTSGSRVPSSTVNSPATSSMLLQSSRVSRLHSSCLPWLFTWEPLKANSSKELPITASRKPRMNRPRVGSEAKACTDTSTPERTRKVPSRLREKADSASSTVQALKVARFSLTAREWSRAVPASQGMKEAFSTGSQNHQPPQPSS
ncbi:hypothetical protein D3C84_720730 [compost metagenome]